MARNGALSRAGDTHPSKALQMANVTVAMTTALSPRSLVSERQPSSSLEYSTS